MIDASRLMLKGTFDARGLMETSNDDDVTNDTQWDCQPISQTRPNAVPDQRTKIRFKNADGPSGEGLIFVVNMLDVHVMGIVGENQ